MHADSFIGSFTVSAREQRARAVAAIGVAAFLLCSPRTSTAQPEVAQAQSLFEQGRVLLGQGKIEQACAAYEASQKLDPAVSTLLHIAACRERNHQIASAWGYFVQAKRAASVQKEPKLMAIASKHADRLRPRLSQLTVNVPEDLRLPGLELWRGIERVEPSMWGLSLPLDGGIYSLTAMLDGQVIWSTNIALANDRDVKVVEVGETVGDAALQPSVESRASAMKSPAASEAASTPSSGPQREGEDKGSVAPEPSASHAPRKSDAGAVAECERLVLAESWGELKACVEQKVGSSGAASGRALDLLTLAAAEKRNKQEFDQFFAAQRRSDLSAMRTIAQRVPNSSVYADRVAAGLKVVVDEAVAAKRKQAMSLVAEGRCFELRAFGLEILSIDEKAGDAVLQMACVYKAPPQPCKPDDAVAVDAKIELARRQYESKPLEVASVVETLLRVGGPCVTPAVDAAPRQRYMALTYLGMLSACRASLRPQVELFLLIASESQQPVPHVCRSFFGENKDK